MPLRFIFAIFLLFSSSAAIASSSRYLSESERQQTETEAALEAYPFPCHHNYSNFDECILGAAVEQLTLGVGKKEFQEYLIAWREAALEKLALLVAVRGNDAQREKLLTIYGTLSGQISQEARGEIILLLSLRRVDDAVQVIQKMADSKIEFFEFGIPQLAGLRFLALTGMLDEGIDFFKKTQHITFSAPKNRIVGGNRIEPFGATMLFSALLRADRKDAALALKNTVDEKSVYKNILKENQIEDYFIAYEGLVNEPDKATAAEKFFKNPKTSFSYIKFLEGEDIEELNAYEKKLFDTLASADRDTAITAFQLFDQQVPAEEENFYFKTALAKQRLADRVMLTKNANIQKFWWEYHIKKDCKHLIGDVTPELEYAQCLLDPFGEWTRFFNVQPTVLRKEYFLAKKQREQLQSSSVDTSK